MLTGLFQAPRVGLEPTTPRLTAACSTIELSRKVLNSLCELTTEELFHNSSKAFTTLHNSSNWILPKRSLLRRLTIWESLRNSLHNSSSWILRKHLLLCSSLPALSWGTYPQNRTWISLQCFLLPDITAVVLNEAVVILGRTVQVLPEMWLPLQPFLLVKPSTD